MLLVALAVEGVTLLDVRGMFTLHAFVGLLLVPVALLKTGSTGYRMIRYYRGDAAYRRRGPPHPILRVLGPVVVLSTLALLGTGIALLAVGRAGSDALVTAHQATFIVWFAATTLHVLGHIVETWRLTVDDLRHDAPRRVPRRGLRRTVVALALVVGVGLGVASLGWHGDWGQHRDLREDARP